jgi:hypothetical protein
MHQSRELIFKDVSRITAGQLKLEVGKIVKQILDAMGHHPGGESTRTPRHLLRRPAAHFRGYMTGPRADV